MADPVSLGLTAGTLGSIGVGGSILGGITGAVGKLMGGQSQANMFQYQSGMAKVNAQIAKQNADYARYTGEVEAQRTGMKSRFEEGTALVTQSGRGVDVGSGSAAEVRESMSDVGKHEADTVRANAMRRAYGHDVEAIKHDTNASNLGRAASSARSASYIDAFGSILGGATSVASKWLDASRLGMGSGKGISLGPSPDFPSAEYEF